MIAVPGPVLLDLNTQRDLFAAEGALPLFQADKLVDPLRRLFFFAQRHHIPVISTRLHNLTVPGHRSPGAGKIVCVPTTAGYQKMPFSTLRRRTEWQLDCETSLPVEGFRTVQQFIFDLPGLNPFECPRLDRLLSEISVESFLVLGAPVEWTIRTAVLGLLARRHKVAVVSDGIGMWDPYEGDMALRQIESKNIEWLTADQIIEKYASPKRRTLRADRAKARATQPNLPPKPSPAQTPRRAFRM